MKSTENTISLYSDRFEAITADEASGINGGETMFYWIAYGVGVVVHTLLQSSGTQTTGQKTMNAALG